MTTRLLLLLLLFFFYLFCLVLNISNTVYAWKRGSSGRKRGFAVATKQITLFTTKIYYCMYPTSL